MRLLLLFCLFSIFSFQTSAQFIYSFNSFPDSASVFMNGELECYTPCKVKYYWRDKVDGSIIFEIKKDNYKDWTTSISSKPTDFNNYEKVFLEKKYEKLDLEKSPVIDFDKIRVNFSDGDKIGSKNWLKMPKEDILWSGSIKVGDETFAEQFYEIATNMGFNTIVSQSSELFANESANKRKLPKYIIGVEIESYNINYNEVKKQKGDGGNVQGTTTIGFDWRVLDKKSSKEVLALKNTASINYRINRYSNSTYNVDVFELALIDFLKSEELKTLLQKGDVEYEREVDETKLITIAELKSKVYTKTSEMVKAVSPACVTVITDGGHGSGVIISEEGLMLTAYHVIEGVNKINVKFSTGIELQAELVSYDEFNDIAILDINGSGFTALPIANEDKHGLGSDVFTIGTPADVDLGQSVSKGMLSGKREKDDQIYFQVDMAVSPGNSGGPLLTENGEVLGVIQSKIIGSGIEGIGFAIPISNVKSTLGITVK